LPATGEGVHQGDIVPGVAFSHAGHPQTAVFEAGPDAFADRLETVQPEAAGTSFQVTAKRCTNVPPHFVRSRATRTLRTVAEPSAAGETRTSAGALASVVA
jgi:hypothetical protein